MSAEFSIGIHGSKVSSGSQRRLIRLYRCHKSRYLMLLLIYIWISPSKSVPGSGVNSNGPDQTAQSDQGLCCPQTESLDTIECFNILRANARMRNCACAEWYESAHFAYDRLTHLQYKYNSIYNIIILVEAVMAIFWWQTHRHIVPLRKHAYSNI